MKKLTFTLLLATASLLWGCGKSKNNPGTLTGGVVGGQCLPGQVRSQTGQCLNQYGCQAGFGFDGSTCLPGTPVTPGQVYQGSAQASFGATLSVTNRYRFESFLERVGGVCNLSNFFSFSLFGPDPFDCHTYSRQGFIIMQIFKNPQPASGFAASYGPAYVTIGAGATSPLDGLYGGMFGGLGYHTVPLNLEAVPINNGKGFKLKTAGGFFGGFVSNFHSEVVIRAENGDITKDSNIHVILELNGREFARALTARQ